MERSDFSLTREEQKEYLESLIGKVHKILHLIEEEPTTGFSPKPFIGGQLFEIHAANALFGGKLINIIVKLKGLYDHYQDMEISECKKQIFEIKKIINSHLKRLG